MAKISVLGGLALFISCFSAYGAPTCVNTTFDAFSTCSIAGPRGDTWTITPLSLSASPNLNVSASDVDIITYATENNDYGGEYLVFLATVHNAYLQITGGETATFSISYQVSLTGPFAVNYVSGILENDTLTAPPPPATKTASPTDFGAGTVNLDSTIGGLPGGTLTFSLINDGQADSGTYTGPGQLQAGVLFPTPLGDSSFEVTDVITITQPSGGGATSVHGVHNVVAAPVTVPEPITLALFGAGIIGLALLKRLHATK